ncbi:MAG: stage III sporulation protein AB [Clostridia bacterium]|nr:stage III sporulation protein AB [Clostridia bacterium]
MRLLGGIGALIICLLWGNSKARALSMRHDIMQCFAGDIRDFAAELEYRPQDIKDITKKLYTRELGAFWREFVRAMMDCGSAEQAWMKAVGKYDEFDVLSPQERMLITETGRSIGKQNLKDSVSSMKRRAEQAEQYAMELSELIKNKGTVYRKLGLLGGLAVMLLMV